MKYLVVNTEQFSGDELPETVQKAIKKYPKASVILDEASYIKTNNPCKDSKKSKRNRLLRLFSRIVEGKRMVLTATPMSKSPVNIYDIMDFLQPKFFRENMFEFAEKYTVRMTIPRTNIRTLINAEIYNKCHNMIIDAAKKGEAYAAEAMNNCNRWYALSYPALRHIAENKEYTPFMHLDELYERIADTTMFARKDQCTDLPPLNYIKKEVKLPSELVKMYKEILKEGTLDDYQVANGAEMYIRLQDVCNGYKPVITEEGEKTLEFCMQSPKLTCLLETLEEIGNEKVVIWSSRTLLLEDIIKTLEESGYKVIRYDGKTSSEEKEKAKEKWLSGNYQIFVGNQRAGGYGLDFLKDAPYAIYLANNASVEQREQSENRVHRIGSNGNRTIIDIVTEGTIEERVLDSLKLGKELIDSGKTDASVFEYRG